MSQRILGVRYYKVFRTLKSLFDPQHDEENTLAKIYSRPYTQTEKIKQVEHEFAMGNIEPTDFLSELAKLNGK